MNRKKKILKIFAAVAAFIMIGVVLFFASVFLGNPISYLIVENSAEKILEENYPDTDYKIDSISYFPIDTCYTVGIVSPTSIDSKFSMTFDFFGEFMHDDYKSRVASKRNTEDRINREYMQKVASVLESGVFPYNIGLASGVINFEGTFDLLAADAGVIPTSELELNKIYDLKSLGQRAGIIIIHVWDDDVTVEKAAEILRTAKQMLDAADIGFNAVELMLFPNKTDEGYVRGESLGISGFPAADIDSPDLIEKINAFTKDTEEFYTEGELKTQ